MRVQLYALRNTDIDFDRIITEGIRYKLQIQQYNSNRDKVELAFYNKALENHALTNQHHRKPSLSRDSEPDD